MDTIYNHNLKFFYFTSPRNGSSVVKDIATRYPEIKDVGTAKAFSILDAEPYTPIYIPFRDPEVRFKSGLAVNLYRDLHKYQDLMEKGPGKLITEGYGAVYKHKLEYIDNIASNNMPYISGASRGFLRRPFHLFDDHVDHSLRIPFTLILYGYNVKLVYLEDWSSHLKTLYPNAIDLITSRERIKSSTTNNPDVYPLWSIYKSIFVDQKTVPRPPELKIEESYSLKTLTWDRWMAPEKKIYKILRQYKDSDNLKEICFRIFKEIINDKVYFTDSFSPSFNKLFTLINFIHNSKESIPEFFYMLQEIHNFRTSNIKISLGECSPPVKPIRNKTQR